MKNYKITPGWTLVYDQHSVSRGVAPGQVRGRYARISEEDKLRLIRAHEADEDFFT